MDPHVQFIVLEASRLQGALSEHGYNEVLTE
jgi:hypothetical protein